jgi:homoserine O-acetyltransferase/O-succinyltransferase
LKLCNINLQRVIFTLLIVLAGSNASAGMLVEKQQFETSDFVTFAGKTIKQVKVGWESYGSLNAKKDNVILITHYFTGNSHAAGKYSEDDQQAGYWDAIIGPGKAIDTDRYFVISVDSLVNAGVNDPHVITTGPASIDPDTGKPYGLSFPVVTIRDFVNVQKAVLESLGIDKLYAVVGASMGSMQAIDWAAAYPQWVPRMISVIGSAQSDPWAVATLEQWSTAIRLDSNWQEGNYYDQQPPLEGLTAALMLITQSSLYPDFINQVGASEGIGHISLEAGPLNDIRQPYKFIQWLQGRAQMRASTMDANHILYLVRANQLFVAGHPALALLSTDQQKNLELGLQNVRAKSLFLASHNDLLLRPEMAKHAYNTLKQLGKSTEYTEIQGNAGHLNGLTNISSQAQRISDFLRN